MIVQAGIVCGSCDRLNAIDSTACEECGNILSSAPRDEHVVRKPAVMPVVETTSPAVKEESPSAANQEEKLMEQARHYICSSCYSPVPAGHKFCGKCGTNVDGVVGTAEPNFFGDMQVPGKAKLILIKGEGMDGISYHLNSTEHVAGRSEGAILFTEDKWLSPRHANFYYDGDKLMLRDEGSVNGIFICLRGETAVASGTVFMAGEQLFRVEEESPYDDSPLPDGTYFFSSPRRDSSFRVVQILEGGGDGMVVHARDGQVLIGRENSDMNFPNDPFISGTHIKVTFNQGLQIADMDSKNGTYLKVLGEHMLTHGDYLFLGRQLLRVEITN